MIAHIYPSVLQAISGRGYAGCLDECFGGCRSEDIQDLGYELPRITIPGNSVNRGSPPSKGLLWSSSVLPRAYTTLEVFRGRPAAQYPANRPPSTGYFRKPA